MTDLDILAIKIRNDIIIKGIKIDNKELKISLLADDITILRNDLSSVRSSLMILKMFHQCSGLNINVETHKLNTLSLENGDYFPHGLS